MEFFDKKEDVIDLKLTQYGRHLLSKGDFNPAFYSFFDDNILYNSENAGSSEEQNRSEERIKEAQTMQPQISISSLEKEFSTNYNLILSGLEKDGAVSLQRTAEKNYALSTPLGTSDINSEYSPSWSVMFLNGILSGSVNYLNLTEKTGGTNIFLIPQLDTDINIKISKTVAGDLALDEYEDGLALSDIVVVSDDDDMHVLLKVAENNGLFQNKNFDIEMFEIQEEDQSGTIIEILRPLAFSQSPDPTTEISFIDEVVPDLDKNYTEYYFDILVDEEINDEVLCKFDPVNEKMGVFADPRTIECQEVLNKQKKKVFDIYEDEADYPGEIC
tara:strand:- start:426 stop:1415 length:990 start_codon:yes stop_codon:yes gene_type:complete